MFLESQRVSLYTNKLNTMRKRSVGGFYFYDESYGPLACFPTLRLKPERRQFSSKKGKLVLSQCDHEQIT